MSDPEIRSSETKLERLKRVALASHNGVVVHPPFALALVECAELLHTVRTEGFAGYFAEISSALAKLEGTPDNHWYSGKADETVIKDIVRLKREGKL